MSGNILNNTVTKYVSHLKFSNSLIYNYHNYTSNQITTNIFLPKQKNTVFLLCQIHNILCKKNYCIHIIIIMIPAINMIHKNCVPQKFKCLPKKKIQLFNDSPRFCGNNCSPHICLYKS